MVNLAFFTGSIISFFLLLCESSALAAEPALTYHGRLLTSAGVPVTGLVNFKIQIRSPGDEDCLLWEETQSQTLDSGVFVLAINGPSSTRTDGGTHAFTDVFSNRQTFNVGAAKCAAGYSSFNPGTADTRVLKVAFNDGTFSGWEDAPNQAINYAPKAIDTLRVSGVPIESLLRFSESDGTLVNTSPLNNAQYTELLALLAGTSDKYLKSSSTEGVTLPVLASQPTLAAGKIWYESATIKYYDASSAQVKTLGTSSAGVATPGSYKSVTVDTYGRVTSGTNPTTVTDYGITDAVKNGGQTGAVTIGSSDANSLSLVTNNTSKMTVLSNGNVGIGVTSPNQLLDVNGNISTNGRVYFSRSGVIPAYIEMTPAIDNSESLAIWTRYGGYTKDLEILKRNVLLSPNGTGKVGIGTTSPSSILHIYNNGTTSIGLDGTNTGGDIRKIDFLFGGSTFGNITKNGATGNLSITNAWASNLTFGTGNAERMRIDSTGNVGIGTTSPLNYGGNYKVLDIRGGSTTEGGILSVGNSDDSVYGQFGMSGAGPGIILKAVSNHPLFFSTNNTERMRISSSGYVGIGTTNPMSPLEVSTTATSGNIANFVSTGAGGGGCSIAWDGVSCSSDIRLKENVVSADSALLLDSLLKVRPVHFSWKNDESHENQTGFIAQELEKIFPEFVKTNDNGYKQVNYAHFAAVLTSGIQEIFKKLQLHDRRIESVEIENANLKAQVMEFKAIKSEICRKDASYSFCKK